MWKSPAKQHDITKTSRQTKGNEHKNNPAGRRALLLAKTKNIEAK